MTKIGKNEYFPTVMGKGDQLGAFYTIDQFVAVVDEAGERYIPGEVREVTLKVHKLVGIVQLDAYYTIEVVDAEGENTGQMMYEVHGSRVDDYSGYERQEGISY